MQICSLEPRQTCSRNGVSPCWAMPIRSLSMLMSNQVTKMVEAIVIFVQSNPLFHTILRRLHLLNWALVPYVLAFSLTSIRFHKFSFPLLRVWQRTRMKCLLELMPWNQKLEEEADFTGLLKDRIHRRWSVFVWIQELWRLLFGNQFMIWRSTLLNIKSCCPSRKMCRLPLLGSFFEFYSTPSNFTRPQLLDSQVLSCTRMTLRRVSLKSLSISRGREKCEGCEKANNLY